ncbi:MAG: LacI family DNA-binding transcriptional regulator [Stackebrandtia sp.]
MTTPSRELKFRRLAAQLRAELRSGVIAPESKLPTEQELAARHGVSMTTVRRALNELADDGLVVRRQGAGTFAAPTGRGPDGTGPLVGVLVPDTTLYYPRVIEGIEDALSAADARLMLASSRYSVSEEDKAIARLIDSGVEGLLAVPTLIGRDDPAAVLARLSTLPVPVVLVERRLDPGLLDVSEHVCTDHTTGGFLAVRHLHELGHRRIAVAVRADAPTTAPVLRGVGRALDEYGAHAGQPHAVPREDWNPAVAAQLVAAITAAEATAVVCFGDREAAALVAAARRAGLDVPGDLAVVAYDDEIADLAEVPLTAVSPPKAHLGRVAAELLLRRLAEPDLPPHQIRLRPDIVIRDSCGANGEDPQ